MARPIQSVLIVGGGTAGWMAAAALQRACGPHVKVRLLESDDIGIVGVGEATVPPIRDFNGMIGLDDAEFMRATQATLKLGIEFVDWGVKGTRYFHPFGTFGPGPTLGDFHQTWLTAHLRGEGGELEAHSVCAQAARLGRVGVRAPDPRSPLSSLFTAYHFDAGLYARYLRQVCEGRGVERIEGEIVAVSQRPEDGFISGVTLKDGRELSAELYIDCTGFRGLLIEGALKTGYEDWSHWLPMNRAWAVPCARVGPTTPYTTSTARDAGWQWRIALQHRTGNGYVYCSGFGTDEETRQTLLDNLDGEALAEPRQLKFVTGRRKAYWAKNVVALGLSSGFIEPLESTSIHLVQSGVTRLLQHFPDSDFSPANIAAYNRRLGREVELVRDFVILHYHATRRDDTPLWRHVREAPIPDSLAERVEAYRDRGLLFQVGADEYFSMGSWMAVMHGQGITPRSANGLYGFQDPRNVAGFLQASAARTLQAAEALPAHEDFLRAQRMWAGETAVQAA